MDRATHGFTAPIFKVKQRLFIGELMAALKSSLQQCLTQWRYLLSLHYPELGVRVWGHEGIRAWVMVLGSG